MKGHLFMFKKLHNQQKGFTLIEVLVVVGILAILLAITLIALNPAKHFADARDAQRSSDIVAILNSVYQYQAANKGTLPPTLSSVSTTALDIRKGGAGSPVDPCADLAPVYIADLPKDPSTGTQSPASGALCSATTYDTGYTIAKSATGNRFTINAPDKEGTATISVTR
jgi:type IV pilus assembly protein PilA